jgi:hypothetical protein
LEQPSILVYYYYLFIDKNFGAIFGIVLWIIQTSKVFPQKIGVQSNLRLGLVLFTLHPTKIKNLPRHPLSWSGVLP